MLHATAEATPDRHQTDRATLLGCSDLDKPVRSQGLDVKEGVGC